MKVADIARQIDAKYHTDMQGNIIKTGNGVPVPDDEPLILFRARDHLALATLLHYKRLCVDDGCNDYQLESLESVIAKFREFRETHPEAMKQPGVTRGA